MAVFKHFLAIKLLIYLNISLMIQIKILFYNNLSLIEEVDLEQHILLLSPLKELIWLS
jgi:hypothetical protein